MRSMIVFLALGIGGCSTIRSWTESKSGGAGEEPATESKPEVVGPVVKPLRPAVDPDEVADLQLKFSRLMARTEELEEKFSRQQERLRIIERGLTLGIVPDELQPRLSKQSKPHRDKPPVKQARVEADEEHDEKAPHDKVPVKEPEKDQAKDVVKDQVKDASADPAKDGGIPVATRDEFNKAFAAAHEDFRGGRFGKAIVAFSEIGKKYDPALTSGVHQFWIARSWAGLKEMQTARQLFSEFIATYPSSPWAPRAKLELARVESALGLKETAIKRLRGVISEHPHEDVAEMAKAEVDRMSRTL